MNIILRFVCFLPFFITYLLSCGQSILNDGWLIQLPPAVQMKGNSLPSFQTNKRHKLSDKLIWVDIPQETSLQQLKASGQILAYEIDQSFQVSTSPNDPYYTQQWGLKHTGQYTGISSMDIQAEAAWDLVSVSDGIAGVIDTGIDYGHEDLVDNIWQNLAEDADGDGKVLEYLNGQWQLDPGDLDGIDADGNGYIDDLVGWDFVNDDNNPMDENGHGTHVAGIIGATGNNGIGITGVAWTTQLMALKAFGANGSGRLSHILEALAYSRQMGVDLTNNSWGGGGFSQFLYDAIQEGQTAEQLFITAAGNNGFSSHTGLVYPAAYDLDNIISVAALDIDGALAYFSNYSAQHVDLAAPGWKIMSCLPGNVYGAKTGTSMATGFVSGAVQLLKANNPTLNIVQLKHLLLDHITPTPSLIGKCQSGGGLNLFHALSGSAALGTGVLVSDFSGPSIGCLQSEIQFLNTSQSPAQANTSYTWLINGISAGSETHFTYTFSTAGTRELSLVASYGGQSDTVSRYIYIESLPQPDLGPDTIVCGPAVLLWGGTDQFSYVWKRISPSTLDFSSQDSIVVYENGGNTSGFEASYVLTDAQDSILEIADASIFSPQAIAGIYRVYGVWYESSTVPTDLTIGNTISDIDLGIDNCSGIQGPFDIGVHEVLGTEPWYSARESGTYVLLVSDACGNIRSDTISVSLTPGCVWPGDVNADGFVSLVDFLSLGIANTQSGPSRSPAESDWSSQSSADWSSSFSESNLLASGVNHKHADADGDGLVNLELDGQIVEAHIGILHKEMEGAVEEGANLQISHTQTIFSSSDTAWIELAFSLEGPQGQNLEDLFGIAFNLNFSESIVAKPNITPTSWLSQTQSMTFLGDGNAVSTRGELLAFGRRKAGIALVSWDGLAKDGGGVFAVGNIGVVIDDIADDPSVLGFSTLTISTEDLLLIDSLGNSLPVNPGSNMQTITIDIFWPGIGSSFPVEWLEIEVEQIQRDALLQWTTVSEYQTATFDIERSVDGILFTHVGSLAASGNSQSLRSYQYLDKDIISIGANRVFYRLKQVDVDGRFTYSKVLTLQIEQDELGLLIHGYPNPFEDELQIEYIAHLQGQLDLRIRTSLGQEFYHKQLSAVEGTLLINTHSWSSGLYFISLEGEHKKIMYKVVKH